MIIDGRVTTHHQSSPNIALAIHFHISPSSSPLT
jgi:hypothetical protein